MVERQMQASILSTGSYWYSAWVDAGQPDLKNLRRVEPEFKNEAADKHEQLYEKGKIIGRPDY